MSNLTLTSCELVRSPLSLIDASGTVFFWEGKVLRAIPAEAAPMVRALIDSGLLTALQEREWIPGSRLGRVQIEGYAFVVEQDRLPVVSYPYEWTYGMLQAAALRVLEINALANTFGWELKDCHGFNIVFDGTNPRFVDLGSFVPRAAGGDDWSAWSEFLHAYEYPLRIWRDGSGFIARRVLAASDMMSDIDSALYRWPLVRWDAGRLYGRWAQLRSRLRTLRRLQDVEIRERLPDWRGVVACAVKRLRFLFPPPSVNRRYARLKSWERRGGAGFWSGYQGGSSKSVETPRFRRIVQLVAALEVSSTVELGGNQGWLSALLLQHSVVKQATCIDADELAIDRAFQRERASGGTLHTAVVDFVHPMVSPFGEPPASRYQGDLVLALAVTHHLLLTQRIPVDRMLRSIAAYSRRHVMIEFMPLGLWDGTRGKPVPSWYTVDWFRAAFAVRFELTHEEQLEENRRLFCGRLRSN